MFQYDALLMETDGKVDVDISYNNISQVNFTDIETLKDLRGYSVFAGASISLVNLSKNPIACDCRAFNLTKCFNDMMNSRLKMMVRFFPNEFNSASPPELRGKSGVKCASPPEQRDKYVEELHPQELTCQLAQLVENYTDCPSGCSCQFRPWDKSVIFNCKNSNLTKFPQILLPSAINHNQTEMHLEGNFLTMGPSSEDIGYENVTKLFLSNNRIKEIKWIPPKTEASNHFRKRESSFLIQYICILLGVTFTSQQY